ncbi:MAG: phosphatase PAP2 family protein [Bacteroides sp.]
MSSSSYNTFWQPPTLRESFLTLGLSALFLLLTAAYIGLRSDHFLMTGLFLGLFFASRLTRKLAVALLPFVVFAISYDWMRVYPNFRVNPIDVQGLYEAEKSLFGFMSGGEVVIPCEYFARHHAALADLFAGIFYLCWVPLPIAFGVWLYFTGRRELYLRFSLVFLLVNLLGFCGYYIHPAAPPWYAMNYGFEAQLGTPGNVAGLGRFDELLGCSIFEGIYGRNANVFAAVPSLHAAYMVVATAYAVMGRCKRWLVGLFVFIMVGIWWTAVYSGHHYLIDVLLGITCALLGILLFEQVLLRIAPFKRFMARYSHYIS